MSGNTAAGNTAEQVELFPNTFTDCKERTWTVTIDIRNDDRIEKSIGVSLVNLVPIGNKSGTLDALGDFVGDPKKVFACFYELVREQAADKKLDKAAVLEGMDDNTTELMTLAVVGAIQRFFRRDPKRTAVLRNAMGLYAKLADQMTKELAKLDVSRFVKIDEESIANAVSEAQKKLANTSQDTSAVSTSQPPA